MASKAVVPSLSSLNGMGMVLGVSSVSKSLMKTEHLPATVLHKLLKKNLHRLKKKILCSEKIFFLNSKQKYTGTSLVVQWFRICLPTEGRGFDPWSGNQDSHMPQSRFS